MTKKEMKTDSKKLEQFKNGRLNKKQITSIKGGDGDIVIDDVFIT